MSTTALKVDVEHEYGAWVHLFEFPANSLEAPAQLLTRGFGRARDVNGTVLRGIEPAQRKRLLRDLSSAAQIPVARRRHPLRK